MDNIIELRKDLEELDALAAQAKRPKVKDILTLGKYRIESTISALEIKEQTKSSTQKVEKDSTPTNKRYTVELNGYAWDQSDKFVKLFVTLDGVHKIAESDVVTVFTENALEMSVNNLNNKDYKLNIKNLHSKINVEKSYQKIKTDMVAIYMHKVKPAENWTHLTLTEKRVKDIKDSKFKTDDSAMKDDPTSGIVNLMKQMYETGDSETKKMIAKAWTESQEKSRAEGYLPPMPNL